MTMMFIMVMTMMMRNMLLMVNVRMAMMRMRLPCFVMEIPTTGRRGQGNHESKCYCKDDTHLNPGKHHDLLIVGIEELFELSLLIE